mgnify:CR=1 FL=1
MHGMLNVIYPPCLCAGCAQVYTTFACGTCNKTQTEIIWEQQALAAYRKARRENEES